MKKLMIAAASVCAAVFAQAASVSWKIETAYDPTNPGDEMGDNGSFYGYLFVNSMTDSSGSSTAFTKAAALEAIAAGDLSFLASAADTDEVFYGLSRDGVGNFADGGASDNVVEAYAIILDTDDPSSATKVFVTDLASTSINSMGASDPIDFGTITATGDYNNWTTVGGSPVPEPTSGLLMLLGVAGLALRRRRA